MVPTNHLQAKLFDKKFVALTLRNARQCDKCKREFDVKFRHSATDNKPHSSRPVLLNCGHNICENCIYQNRHNLTCSVCSVPIELEHTRWLKKSYDLNFCLLGQLINSKSFLSSESASNHFQNGMLAQESFIQKCSECEQATAVGVCMHCKVDFCKRCFHSVHQNSKVLKKHRLSEFEVQSLQLNLPKEKYCKIHRRLCDKYCHDCQNISCSNCISTSHSTHFCTPLNVENANHKDKVMCLLETLKPARESIRTSQKRRIMPRLEAIRSLSTRTSDVDALAMRGYSIGHKIGEGSYATVISAVCEDEHGGELNLACKVIDKKKAPKDYLNKFFPRELDILTKIDHPNIIQVHSILERGPKIFIFMQFAENGDLLTHISKNNKIGELQSKAWFLQMAKALRYLHSHDIAHRDLKCENILLSQRMNIKLTDFGFARYCSDQNGQPIQSQTYCGSAAYAAPEVVAGNPYDPKLSDVWSLGVILFIMLNKKMPFDDRDVKKLLDDQMNRRYSYRRKYVDKISEEAKSVVRVLLEPEPYVRWDLTEILNSNWLKDNSLEPSKENL